eukprot:4917263-Prymnesium_polylepis.1
MNASGGAFDAIIDDGSHVNSDIMGTFTVLWPHLRPGGLYFLEDLQLGRAARAGIVGKQRFEDTNGTSVVADVIQSWVEQLLIQWPPPKTDATVVPIKGKVDLNSWDQNEVNGRAVAARQRFPLPTGAAF